MTSIRTRDSPFFQSFSSQLVIVICLSQWILCKALHSIHTIVLGGGLDDENKWKETGGKFFLPYGVISKVFRGKYLDELKSLWNDSKLKFHGTAEKYQNSYRFKELLDKCYEKNWVTYCKETFNGAQSVINYLGKYTHRIAISNHRIKSMTDTTVTYVVKDYKNEGCWKEKTISGEEFIRRFMMHVPPKRFVRIRHYGLLSCINKRKKDNSLQKPAWM